MHIFFFDNKRNRLDQKITFSGQAKIMQMLNRILPPDWTFDNMGVFHRNLSLSTCSLTRDELNVLLLFFF